ncbi:MAG TPA: winged helix-turn-helix transcriptional regulator [Patescibacteria group bacterium]|nr:winged helix-turn-helix transcriptional regulator [Patescibacteria group bacterium]
MDKEYIILESIDNNSMTTQRELSKKLGISLGSINLLINKMVREGLIKVERVNTNTILYMLTPKGFMEKLNKTYNYIRIHYKYISEVKEKFKYQLSNLDHKAKIVVVLEHDEISDLVATAIKELNRPNLMQKSNNDDIDPASCLIVVVDNELYGYYKDKGYEVVNLMERI